MASFAEQLALRAERLSKVSKEVAVQLQPEFYDSSCEGWRAWTCASESSDVCPVLDTLRVLSFNIMKERQDLAERMGNLLQLVESLDPDFICLQENTVHHDRFLASSPLLQRYWRSTFQGQDHGFKVSLYSKLRFHELWLYDLKGRPCVTGFIELRPDVASRPLRLAVSSVHLTSGNNAGIRGEQLRLLHAQTLACETSLIAGDFNACLAEDDSSVGHGGYLDAWPALHGSSPGTTRVGSSARLDRVALRSDSWAPDRMEVIGSSCRPQISDHWGLFAVLRRS